jgi:hypothetical protein
MSTTDRGNETFLFNALDKRNGKPLYSQVLAIAKANGKRIPKERANKKKRGKS